MAIYSTKVKPGWRPSEVRDLVVAFVIAIVLWTLFLTQAVGPAWNGLLIGVAAVFSLAGLLGLYFNITRKRNAELLAEMNTDNWRVQWWGRKPLKAVWGEKLSPLHNNGDMKDVERINFTKVGRHEIFEFFLPAGRLTLPKRLADTDEVRDFLLAWVESRNGAINASDKASMEAFVEVLNRGRHAPGAGSELEEESPAVETADAAVEESSPTEAEGDLQVSDQPEPVLVEAKAAKAQPLVQEKDPFADYIAALEAKKKDQESPTA